MNIGTHDSQVIDVHDIILNHDCSDKSAADDFENIQAKLWTISINGIIIIE